MLRKNAFCSILLTFAMLTFNIVVPNVSAEKNDIIPNDLANADIAKINSALLAYGSATPPDSGWFNVGLADAKGATSAQYTAPQGGVQKDDANMGVKLTIAKSGIAHALFTDTQPRNGYYEVKFSVLPNGSEFGADVMGTIDLLYNRSESGIKRSVLLNVNSSGNIFIPQAATPVFNMSASWYAGKCDINKWLDVTAVYRLDSANASDCAVMITVKQDGKTVAKQLKNNFGVGESIKNNGLGFIRFNTNTVKNGCPTVKDVTVKKLDAKSDIAYAGFGEDFSYGTASGYTKSYLMSQTAFSNALAQSGWFVKDMTSSDCVDFCTDNGTDFISVAAPVTQFGATVIPSWVGGIKGVTHYMYRIKIETDNYIRALVLGNAKPAALEFTSAGNVRVNGDADEPISAANSKLIGTYDSSKWIDVDQYVDTENAKWYVKVSQDGEVFAEANEVFVRPTLAASGVDTFRFDAAQNSSYTLLVDDIQIEKVDAVPFMISEKNITVTDADGSSYMIKPTLSPTVAGFSIDFGMEMPDPVAAEGITLSGGGESINFTLTKSGDNTWVITPKTLLASNTEYTLNIPKALKSMNGASLAEAFQYCFTTENMKPQFKTSGIKINGAIADYLTAAHSGCSAAVEADVVNPLAENIKIEWIIAYYDISDRLLSVDMLQKTVDAQSIFKGDQELVLNIPKNTVRTKMFFWNGDTIEPLCNPFEIKNYEAAAKFGLSDAIDGMTANSLLPSEEYYGIWCRRLSKTNDNFYLKCNINDDIMYDLADGTPVDVEVEYFDGESGYFSLQYDSTNPDTGLYSNNTAMQQSDVVYLSGTNTWKTKVFHLDDMKMTNRVSNGDFRVAAYCYKVGTSPSDVFIGSINVKYSEVENT